METVKRKSIYARPFASRTGRKAYFFALPIAMIMMLLPLVGGILGTILFAGLMASRLNDVGRPRWHAAWLTLWMLLVVTVAAAHQAHGATMAHHMAALGLIELPLIPLLLGLGLLPGQKVPNRFGPVPIGLREFLVVQRDARAYRKSYAKVAPDYQKLFARQKQLTTRIAEVQKQMQDRRAAADLESVNALRSELDEALRASRETSAQLQEINAAMAPALAQFKQSQQRIRENLDYRSAA